MNSLGQPVGFQVPDFQVPQRPSRDPIEGRWARLEPLDPDQHVRLLHDAFSEDLEGRCWTYMPYGPFASESDYRSWAEGASQSDDPFFYAIRELPSEHLGGVASYLRITPNMGSIEVGHICLAPRLQRTRAATETMFLMMRHAFDLGYRRYEWKCDALNEASRRAADRLGFVYEGIHRQAVIYKNRNRDTAWYSVLDHEWSPLRERFERWLDPANFDADGTQRAALGKPD